VDTAIKDTPSIDADVQNTCEDGEVLSLTSHRKLMHGRRCVDGLPQAIDGQGRRKIEAREPDAAPTHLTRIISACTKSCAGMTGDAETEAPEFDKIYKLEVVGAPPNKRCVAWRTRDSYSTEKEKYGAAADRNRRGWRKRPGTVPRRHNAIEKSERRSDC